MFQHIPWSILGFRLQKSKDAKDCVEVRVEGAIKSPGADIKVNSHIPSSVAEVIHRGNQGIWPPRKANDLSVFETKHTSGLNFQIGLDSTAKALTSLTLTTASEHSSKTGQTLVPYFGKQGFKVTLGIKKGSPSGMCVADLVEFFVLVQLSKERIPMTLEVTANVVYKGFLQKKEVQGR